MSKIKIDIVSDVVCPWCIVGYKQLEKALDASDEKAEIHWHPYELNPTMPPEGQHLGEHIAQKYGSTPEQSIENRNRLTEVGIPLDIPFNFKDDSRMVNTYKAHQLLHWAGLQCVEHEHALKLALFAAYFTDQQDVSSDAVLLACVLIAELDATEAQDVLHDGRFETEVRQRQQVWTNRGITGVPAMVFNDKYLVTGAQGIENYISVIKQIKEEENAMT